MKSRGKKSEQARVAEKRRPGRQPIYSDEIVTEILRRMSEGETLTAICEEDGMPSASTLNMRAINDDPPGFAARYARARELQALAIGESALNIADRCTDAIKARLQVDTRKWFASKMHPSKFGDRSQIEHSGAVTNVDVTKLTNAQLDRLAAGEPLDAVLASR